MLRKQGAIMMLVDQSEQLEQLWRQGQGVDCTWSGQRTVGGVVGRIRLNVNVRRSVSKVDQSELLIP